MKLCGVLKLLDGKKNNEDNVQSFVMPQYCCMVIIEMNTMKLCGATALLHSNKSNEYYEAL